MLIGIAPQGGRMPDEWRAWLAEALDHGCDLWSGLHTFLGDDLVLAREGRVNGAARSSISDARPRTCRSRLGSPRRSNRSSSSRSGPTATSAR